MWIIQQELYLMTWAITYPHQFTPMFTAVGLVWASLTYIHTCLIPCLLYSAISLTSWFTRVLNQHISYCTSINYGSLNNDVCLVGILPITAKWGTRKMPWKMRFEIGIFILRHVTWPDTCGNAGCGFLFVKCQCWLKFTMYLANM